MDQLAPITVAYSRSFDLVWRWSFNHCSITVFGFLWSFSLALSFSRDVGPTPWQWLALCFGIPCPRRLSWIGRVGPLASSPPPSFHGPEGFCSGIYLLKLCPMYELSSIAIRRPHFQFSAFAFWLDTCILVWPEESKYFPVNLSFEYFGFLLICLWQWPSLAVVQHHGFDVGLIGP